MTDHADNKFSRKYKYDWAARLVNNKIQSPNQSETVYTQDIEYDAYSQMTSRSINHWGSGASFTATYTNGREQTVYPAALGTVYDPAGNQVHTGTDSDGLYQTRIFDAANRNVRYTFRFKDYGRVPWPPEPTITTYVMGHEFDGDGRSIVSKAATNETSELEPLSYQIWSSALGAFVTEVGHSGLKRIAKDGVRLAFICYDRTGTRKPPGSVPNSLHFRFKDPEQISMDYETGVKFCSTRCRSSRARALRSVFTIGSSPK